MPLGATAEEFRITRDTTNRCGLDYPHPTVGAAQSFVPGLGHFYLGKPMAGTAILAAELGLITTSFSLAYEGKDPELAMLGFLTSQDMLLYSLHDVYRGARRMRSEAGYAHPLPDEGLFDHLTAIVDVRFLTRWTTLTVLSVPAALAAASLQDGQSMEGESIKYKFLTPFTISLNASLGEEAFFRGFLFPELEHRIGTPAAMALSAIAFGMLHYNPAYTDLEVALSLGTTTLFGAYMNWLVKRNDYSLRESIFIHFWWDMLLIGAQALASNEIAFKKAFLFDF
jgi:membrane protease YdiL (CAAX protease family)